MKPLGFAISYLELLQHMVVFLHAQAQNTLPDVSLATSTDAQPQAGIVCIDPSAQIKSLGLSTISYLVSLISSPHSGSLLDGTN